MKKIISVLSAVLIMGAFCVTAFAATPKLDNRINTLTQRQAQIATKAADISAKKAQFQTKTAEFDAFKTALASKRATLLDNKQTNLDLVAANNALRLELANAIKAIKDSGATITDTQKADLTAQNAKAKEIIIAIKATKGQIQALVATNKANMKTKDYVVMNSTFDQIYTIQNWRNEQLKELNTILSDMLTIVK